MIFNKKKVTVYKDKNCIQLEIPKNFNDGLTDKHYHFNIEDFTCSCKSDYFICGTNEFKRAYLLEEVEFDDYVRLLYSINKLKDFNHI